MAPGERANRGVDYGQAGVGGSSVFARRRVRAHGTVANSPGAAMMPGTLPKAPESEDEKKSHPTNHLHPAWLEPATL
jgi:hypothetical protein